MWHIVSLAVLRMMVISHYVIVALQVSKKYRFSGCIQNRSNLKIFKNKMRKVLGRCQPEGDGQTFHLCS